MFILKEKRGTNDQNTLIIRCGEVSLFSVIPVKEEIQRKTLYTEHDNDYTSAIMIWY